ncbi:MAG: hypothetical protein WBP79_04760 [Candidatus Acidiferrales bacterium]
MKNTLARFFLFFLLGVAIFASLGARPVRAGEKLTLPPEALNAMEKMYGGDLDAAIVIARGLEQAQPENALGYLLEAEARWWKIYCAACDIKWGRVEAAKRARKPEDDAYLALADRVIQLTGAGITKSDTSVLHLYAGIGWALKARLYGLRSETRNAAHAGVSARTEFLRALQLDPQMADAKVGLGLYNYYVDTLSSFVKFLRFFMGIPGGNKKEGIQQLETGMKEGVLMAVEARFYLAKNLRTYDEQYEQAAVILEPLVLRYPKNPIFLLLLGNLNAELNRKEPAVKYFHAALDLSIADPACATRVGAVANSFLMSLH